MQVKTGVKAILDRYYSETPTYLHPSKFSIGTTQDDPVFTDTALTDEIEFTVGVTEKDFESGYPVVDLDNLTGKTRLFINSLEANGESISGIAIKDSNGEVFSINKIDAQNKTSSVEIAIIKGEIWDD
jgi:hypothetical protein